MKQEVKNFKKFYSLLKMMPGVDDDMKERLVWKFTDYRTNSLREMKKVEYGRMLEYMENMSGGVKVERKRKGYFDDDAKMWRKRAIASVFGFYKKINEEVSMEYVKGIICRAGSATDMNHIAPAKMREIYNSWVAKQRVRQNVDQVVDDELVKFGYLEKGGSV